MWLLNTPQLCKAPVFVVGPYLGLITVIVDLAEARSLLSQRSKRTCVHRPCPACMACLPVSLIRPRKQARFTGLPLTALSLSMTDHLRYKVALGLAFLCGSDFQEISNLKHSICFRLIQDTFFEQFNQFSFIFQYLMLNFAISNVGHLGAFGPPGEKVKLLFQCRCKQSRTESEFKSVTSIL